MKKLFSTVFLLAFTLLAFSRSVIINDHFEQMMQIDSTDTVTIDLSQLQLLGSQYNFPVSFNSDDIIYSLDFELKYVPNNLEFDSIISLISSMELFWFYNTNDSTYRFTSYTNNMQQPYPNNTTLVRVQYDLLLAPQISGTDLYDFKGYLNGTECSVKIINPTSGILTLENGKQISVYPNPAAKTLNITTDKNLQLEIMTITGTTILNEVTNQSGITELNISDLANGMYFLKISDNTSYVIKPFIKCDQ